jgi:DNA-binding NarL/FixJ family response regulator
VRAVLGDVIEASREALTLAELGRDALDRLQRGLGCSFGSLARCPADGAVDMVGGSDLGVMHEYHRSWFAIDPVNEAIERQGDSWIIPAGRLPEWKDMQRHPLYAEWAPTKHVSFLLHLRLSEARYLESGATNIFLGRSKEDGDFRERDVLAVAQVLPALLAAVARCERVAAMNTTVPFLESMLEEVEGRARLALRADGRLVWVSKAAQRILAGHLGEGRSLPASLVEAARSVTRGGAHPATLRFPAGGANVTAEVRRATATTGETFASIDLRSPIGDLPGELRKRFGLTGAEAEVLSDVAKGLSNAEIARQRFVSVTTVRTHVAHILSKMGVHSRLQACVLVRATL